MSFSTFNSFHSKNKNTSLIIVNVTALAIDTNSVSVSFKTNTVNIAGYIVTSDIGNFFNTGLTSPIIISGLTGNSLYTFTVSAINTNVNKSSNSIVTYPALPNIGSATNITNTTAIFPISLINQGNSNNITYSFSGLGNGIANVTSTSISLTSLSENTSYTLYATATTTVGKITSIKATTFTTPSSFSVSFRNPLISFKIGNYTVYNIKSDNIMTVSNLSTTINYCLVGGGGSGGFTSSPYRPGQGGGGGGVNVSTLPKNSNVYNFSIGSGGIAPAESPGNSGQNSTIFNSGATIISNGGAGPTLLPDQESDGKPVPSGGGLNINGYGTINNGGNFADNSVGYTLALNGNRYGDGGYAGNSFSTNNSPGGGGYGGQGSNLSASPGTANTGGGGGGESKHINGAYYDNNTGNGGSGICVIWF